MAVTKPLHADLFSGCGGAVLGMRTAGFKLAYMCENNSARRRVLARHFPGTPIHEDIRDFTTWHSSASYLALLSAGDPCQSRSRCKLTRGSAADLSGYVLAVVARERPRWLVRENVLSPDVGDFCAGLELLGYDSVVVEADGRDFSAQSRRRHFVVAGPSHAVPRFRRALAIEAGSGWPYAQIVPRTLDEVSPCLGTQQKGYVGIGTALVWEPSKGRLRNILPDEHERLMGFPVGWTAGLPATTRHRMLGNAWIVGIGEAIGRAILAASSEEIRAAAGGKNEL